MAGAFIVNADPNNPKDILFNFALNGPDPIPDDQLDLKDEIEQSLQVTSILFEKREGEFNLYYRQLLSLAQAGLVGNAAKPEIARRALKTLQDYITTKESGRIKNEYMKKLGFKALMLGTPTLAIAIISHYLSSNILLENFLWLWSGCMGGVWLSFGTRKTELQFKELHIIESDRMEPAIRLVFAGMLTIALGLFFSTEATEVTLGKISTSQINADARISILIGIVCGLSEKLIASKLTIQPSTLLQTK